MDNGLLKVISAMDDTPAAKAGILSGDIITAIDDQAVKGLTLEQAANKMKGPVDAKVRLKIVRKGADQPLDLTIARDIIRVKAVRYHLDGDIGYIRIPAFDEQTTVGLKKAINDISSMAPSGKLAGYVVDLRNNPGGLLDEAVSVASAFMPRGEIVSTRGRNPEETQRFSARSGDLTKGKPLVALINHKRATLVGTRTFGKGSVQTIIPLGAGRGALALTTARYYTPSGRSIQAQGIAPDVEVLQDVPDELKARTDSKGEASLPGHLKAEGAEKSGSQSYIPPDEKNDKALHEAIDLLRGATSNAAFPPNGKAAVPN